MESNETSSAPIFAVLQRAGALHSRQRALLFLLRSAVWLVIIIPLLMLADVLFHLSDHLRLAGAVGVILVILGALGIAFWITFFVRPPLLRVARLLESRNPALGSKLINILQLDAESSSAESAPLTRILAQRAVADAGKSLDLAALPALAREPKVPQAAVRAFSALGLIALMGIFGGPYVRQEWLRFLDPYGDHPAFSLTHLEIIKPITSDRVLYGGAFTVEARASGHQPRELFVTAKSVGNSQPPVTLPMSARGDGTFVARIENIREALELTVQTGDGGSRSHRQRLEIVLTPQISSAVVRISPPIYTGQKSRDFPYRFTALQVLAGSKIEFQVKSNRPLGTGKTLFKNGTDAPASFPLQPANEGPPDRATTEITAEQSGRFTFSLVDVEGNAATESPTAALTVTLDLPPAIVVTVPDQDALVVEGLTIPIMIDATDDYGLASMRLHIGINEQFLTIDPVKFDAPDTRRHRVEYPLDLAKIGAKAGDQITLFAEAVDTRPDPQLTRTSVRRIGVITENDYNEQLREKADVAMIAGNYEELLTRFEERIKEQKRIEEQLASLREKLASDPNYKELAGKFAEAFSDQNELNERLDELANDMSTFGRENPVYDFEKELHQKLREQASEIRKSTEQNRADGEKAIENAPSADEPPSVAMLEETEKAAREQRERLQGDSDKAKEEIQEPLQELAQLHELMKDFNRFQQLTEEQREIAEQTKAYQNKPELNAEDRLALREMGAAQRDIAPQLDELAKKLKHDAEAAKETFPEAAESARQLAEQMDSADMPGLARHAAQSMLDAKAGNAQAQATSLLEQMDRLFEDAGQAGQQDVAGGLDRALRLQRGMKPGDSLRQMMLSQNFRPLPGEGGSSSGQGGMMASSMTQGSPMLLGGQSLLDGPIANSIAGQGNKGGAGISGAPTAKLDPSDQAKIDQQSARRTDTPGSSTLLLEYENIADAYFRRLTTKP